MVGPGPLEIAAHWWWLILALILAIAEILLPGVFLIWLGAAALLTGIVTLAFPLPAPVQVAIFAVAAIAAVYAGRRWLKANPIVSSDPLLNDRTARLVGHNVVVVKSIVDGEGRVKVADGVWNARGPDLPVGAQARVVGADGNWLIVEPL